MAIDASSGLVAFSGLGSGLDSGSIIRAMVAAAHVPIDRLQQQAQQLTAHKNLFARVSTQLQQLGSLAGGLDSAADFLRLGASGVDPAQLTAAVGSTAQAGSTRIEVQQLAAAQRSYSNVVADAHAAGTLGAGTLTVQGPRSSPLTIDVDGSTSLWDVVNQINAAGLGASATVVDVGGGARLRVEGSDTGAAGALQFTENGTTLGLGAAANQAQAAQDAIVVLDGITTVQRPGNVIGDAIEGVTLALRQAGGPAQVLRIGVDEDAVVGQVQGLLDGYNAVVRGIADAAEYRGQADPGRLVGDATLRNLGGALQAWVARSVGSGADGAPTALSQLGVATQKDGTLTLDRARFVGALAAAPEAVTRLFAGDPATASRGLGASLQDLVGAYTSVSGGLLVDRTHGIDGQLGGLDLQQTRLQRNLATYEATLKHQFNQLETTMARLRAQNATLGAMQAPSGAPQS